MTSSPSQAPAAGKSPSTVPDGLALFRHWLETEGAKGWDALDTAPDSGYEKVWRAWLRSLGDVGMSAKEDRSEERRVGEECRSRWSPYHLKKKKYRADSGVSL